METKKREKEREFSLRNATVRAEEGLWFFRIRTDCVRSE